MNSVYINRLRSREEVLPKPALPAPGIYLMRLRSHLNQGKTALTQFVSDVARTLPAPPKLASHAREER